MSDQWQDFRGMWFNYQSQEYENPGKNVSDFTDDDAMKYIPAIPSAHMLYDLHRRMDASIPDAMLAVLKACVGDRS